MPTIYDAEQYWQVVDAHWGNLLSIIAHHLDMCHPAYEVPGNEKEPPTGRMIGAELEHLRKTRNPLLGEYFAVVWCLASEAYAWSVPSWAAFCDLCSERWVLEPDENVRGA